MGDQGAMARGLEKDWDAFVGHAEELAATPAFRGLRDRIIRRSGIGPGDRVLDIGAGTGLLALAVAHVTDAVVALDASAAMCRRLGELARARGLDGRVAVIQADAASLPFDDAAFDLVVSNYCLHHLEDARKLQALHEIHRVLRPGGRLVVGDMMFSLSLAGHRDRAIVARKVRALLAKGPGGAKRVATNACRVLTHHGEHPAPPDWWREALRAAGFEHVAVDVLPHEGGIVYAERPWPPRR
jgi:ubiquinone/menaquinone biosynthesis C-methylase UbiE